ncbi:type II toxin-antitoxin system RelB/DinJ family antitoxin [Actinomyces faecalis]|uniref:type II toxin-antitoxin system RelB/DinJ family antitoxin n=1 Tax=Actinomyces faecalis TaxID=2722820 RepID=UPI001555E7E8|nr:type II toxin-antitoxin system RelB/DinJ family antitoxin [Actinomyces faecalis]
MTTHTVNVNFKVDPDLKAQVEEVVREMGLTMTTALTVYMRKIAMERRIPFEITADPFYHSANIAHLEHLKAELDAGRLPLSDHALIEE